MLCVSEHHSAVRSRVEQIHSICHETRQKFAHEHRLVPSVYVFFILADSDSCAVAQNSSSENKKHIHIL